MSRPPNGGGGHDTPGGARRVLAFPAPVPVRTKRWNDPSDADDGFRLLVCRFRPRGVAKADETWDEWWPELGPSQALHAAYWGKSGPPLSFAEYTPRYFVEMRSQIFRIRALADRVAAGETVTLLCSSACEDPSRCHRTLLAALVEKAAGRRR
jgi:uncharacterized protein YeaO (DUF488 family)